MIRKNGVGNLTFGTLGYRLVYEQAGRVQRYAKKEWCGW